MTVKKGDLMQVWHPGRGEFSVGNWETISRTQEELASRAKKRSDQKTPERAIKDRPGRGRKTFSYAKVDFFEDLLNKDFPGWSYEVKEWKIVGRENSGFVVAHVRLTIIDLTFPRVIEDIGGAEIKYYKDDHETRGGDYLNLPNDVKAAVTDALKRCCYRLGYARDLKYDPEDLDITEDQMAELSFALQKVKDLKPETFDKIMTVVYKKINQANYKNFMIKQIMPLVKKVDPETYHKLTGVYGEIAEVVK